MFPVMRQEHDVSAILIDYSFSFLFPFSFFLFIPLAKGQVVSLPFCFAVKKWVKKSPFR